MTFAPSDPPGRKPRPTNVSLDGKLLDEARALGVNISKACETGLAQHLKKIKAEKWLEDNREAIAESNAYVEKYGLPLAKYRQF